MYQSNEHTETYIEPKSKNPLTITNQLRLNVRYYLSTQIISSETKGHLFSFVTYDNY